MFDFVVLGSGPSSLASLRKIPNGKRVAVIEPRVEVPAGIIDLQQLVLQAFQESNSGTYAYKKLIRHQRSFLKSSLTTKMYWGSDFVYAVRSGLSPASAQVRGGFSMVWGATCFPYSVVDFNKMQEFAVGEIIQAVAEIELILDVAHDGQGSFFYRKANSENLRGSAKIMNRNFGFIYDEQEIYYEIEPTRLAVSAKNYGKDAGRETVCIACGLCQVGCPTGHIWNSRNQFEIEIARLAATVIDGLVTEFKEDSRGVTVFFDTGEGHSSVLTKRLFLTSGVTSTLEILVKSGTHTELKLLDSQTVLLAFVKWNRVSTQNIFNQSLADVSLSVASQGLLSHLQLYTFNDYFLDRIYYNYRFTRVLPKRLWKRILERYVIFGFAYFPQEISGSLTVSRMGWKIERQPSRGQIRKTLKVVQRVARRLGLFLVPLRVLLPIGAGNHTGSNLFLKNTWKSLNGTFWNVPVDDLGRVEEFNNVHILDATSHGPIPIGSVTLATMAQATILSSRIIEEDS
jgi:ferredoxin